MINTDAFTEVIPPQYCGDNKDLAAFLLVLEAPFLFHLLNKEDGIPEKGNNLLKKLNQSRWPADSI